MIGHQIGGRYRIIQRLGGGGMGVVYQAEDMLLGRDVALKVLRAHLAEDDAFRRRFAREGRSAAGLSHPNIVQVYDVGETPEGVPYLVMEYVEGQTLEKVLREHGALGERESVDIAIQVASALAEAHRRGVVHRDIKPLNILVRADGTVKVADFGIARAASGATLVNTGTIVGSAHYVSPEQARGGYVDEKTDVYSLGIVLYEMLTGRTPFQGDTAIAVALKHLQDDVPPPSNLTHVSRSLEGVVLRALEKDPSRRYPGASALLTDLEAVREEMETGRTATVSRHRSSSSRQGGVAAWVWAGAAVILAAILAAGYYYEHYIVPQPVRVPALVGLPLTTATNDLGSVGLVAHVREPGVYSNSVAAGSVVSTIPRKGGRLLPHQRVTLVLSMGPPAVKGGVPNVQGQGLSAAEQELSGVGLRVVQVLKRPSNVYALGEVAATVPAAGAPIREGQPLTIILSTGTAAARVTMPPLTGMPLASWQAALTAKGLSASEIRYGASSAPAGQVLSQQPSAGTPVGPGSNIQLVLSPGPGGQAIAIPGVVQQQSATIVLPKTTPVNASVMVKVVDAHGSSLVNVTPQAKPGQTITVTYTWQGDGTLQIWINGTLTQGVPLPIASAP